MDLTTEFALFGALVIALVVIGRRVYGAIDARPGPLPKAARCDDRRRLLLEEAIVHGYGRIRVGDSSWRVAGADCLSGAMVRVVAVDDGSVLRVERVEAV